MSIDFVTCDEARGLADLLSSIDEIDTSDAELAAHPPSPTNGNGLPFAHLSDESLPQVEGYEILAVLGEGGMGTVWRARQLATRREVALKLIAAGRLASRRARARFEREVELTARLQHPNIARVYDSGIRQGIFFYAMELIDGVPLDKFAASELPERGPARIRVIIELGAKICRAVQHAHEQGVIHRDLKPSNILIGADGEPHVLDFGIARSLLQADEGLSVTVEGAVAGTPGFMAPEQIAGGAESADTRADIWSLGATLVCALTGQTPHDTSGPRLDVMRRAVEEDVRRPRDLDPAIDAELETVLLKSLARAPSERYASAGELAADLDRYLRGEPLAARPPTLSYLISRRARKHRLPIALSAGVAVTILGVLAFAYVRIARERNHAVAEQRRADREKRVAEENARTAATERAVAQNQRVIADAARREAQSHLADSLVDQADSLAQAGRWVEAKLQYEEAEKALHDLGRPTLPAESGLALAYTVAPPPLNVFTGHRGAVTATGFSVDGRFAVSGSEDTTVRIWDVVTGRCLRTLVGQVAPVTCVAFAPDARNVIAGADDGAIVLWDIDSVGSSPNP